MKSEIMNFKNKPKPFEWAKANLFSSPGSAILTCISALLLIYAAKGILTFIFFTARWDVISANLKILMVGQYNREEVWRVWVSLSLVVLLMGISWGISRGMIKLVTITMLAVFVVCGLLPFIAVSSRIWIISEILLIGAGYLLGRYCPQIKKVNLIGWLISFPVIILLLSGAGILPQVKSNLWGGFLLTVLIAVVTIVFSFPIGILLCLGRRSKLPVVKWFSIVYIEVIRGIPLITVLFGAQLLLPLFLGSELELSNVLRVMIGFTLFNAAYVAETVRGGMQAIPRGQFEAAEALGLNYLQRITFVIMPQALRNVVPALVGTVIEVFKDTSLVAIVSLMDLMGIAKRVIANPQFLGRQMEVFIFVACVFLILSTVFSKISKKLELSTAYVKK